jgi:hypothetical protein
MPRGIREVPTHLDKATYDFLQDIRQSVLEVRGLLQPPRPPTNLIATPLPGGNLIQWTTSDADYYQVLWAATPNLANAIPLSPGTGGQFQDIFGAAATKRFYWVYAFKDNGRRSITPAGPVFSTSNALNAPVVPPTPPVSGDQIVIDPRTGFRGPRGPIQGGP